MLTTILRAGSRLGNFLLFHLLDRSYEVVPIRPKLRWIVAGLGLYLVLSFLTMGSALMPALVLTPAWLVAMGLITRAECKERTEGFTARACFYLNILCASVAFLSVFYAYYRASTPQAMIALLDYDVTATTSKLIPRIIARGQPIVAPLIRATENVLAPNAN